MGYHCPYCGSIKQPRANPPGCGKTLMGCGCLLLILASLGLLCPLVIFLPLFAPDKQPYCPDCKMKVG